MPRRKLTLNVERITPAVAEEYLGLTVGNRPARKGRVARYAADVANGDWRMTGEPIKFDSSGRLIDGHHRLNAVVVAGKPADFLVARGIDDDANVFIDTGLSRTLGDALHFDGQPTRNASNIAAAARCVYCLRNGIVTGEGSVPRQDVYALIADNLTRWERVAHEAVHPASLIGANRSAWTALTYITDAKGRPFRNKIVDGVGLQAGSQPLGLRNALSGRRNQGAPTSALEHFYSYLRAYDLDAAGQPGPFRWWKRGHTPYTR